MLIHLWHAWTALLWFYSLSNMNGSYLWRFILRLLRMPSSSWCARLIHMHAQYPWSKIPGPVRMPSTCKVSYMSDLQVHYLQLFHSMPETHTQYFWNPTLLHMPSESDVLFHIKYACLVCLPWHFMFERIPSSLDVKSHAWHTCWMCLHYFSSLLLISSTPVVSFHVW